MDLKIRSLNRGDCFIHVVFKTGLTVFQWFAINIKKHQAYKIIKQTNVCLCEWDGVERGRGPLRIPLCEQRSSFASQTWTLQYVIEQRRPIFRLLRYTRADHCSLVFAFVPILLPLYHYENTPIQIYWKFHHRKWKFLDKKILTFFYIFAQNIDCGYSLEPPRRGGSNEYPQSMFWAEIRKIMYTPVNPSFTL